MPTRFTLPHIDIARFATTSDYMGVGTGAKPDARVRAEHGRRIQEQLKAAFELADATRTADERLPNPEGSLIEVELRAGTNGDKLTQDKKGIRTGAVKVGEDNRKIISLYVTDEARPVLDAIIESYISGELTDKGNPPKPG